MWWMLLLLVYVAGKRVKNRAYWQPNQPGLVLAAEIWRYVQRFALIVWLIALWPAMAARLWPTIRPIHQANQQSTQPISFSSPFPSWSDKK